MLPPPPPIPPEHGVAPRWNTGLMPVQHPVRATQQVFYTTRHEARQRAAALIMACLDDERQLNFSFSYWPQLTEHRQDSSLNVAYHMLWHFECDAGLHHNGPHTTEAYYADIQFELLKEVARLLATGHSLPWEMLEVYQRVEAENRFSPHFYTPWWQRTLEASKGYIVFRYTQLDAWVRPWCVWAWRSLKPLKG